MVRRQKAKPRFHAEIERSTPLRLLVKYHPAQVLVKLKSGFLSFWASLRPSVTLICCGFLGGSSEADFVKPATPLAGGTPKVEMANLGSTRNRFDRNVSTSAARTRALSQKWEVEGARAGRMQVRPARTLSQSEMEAQLHRLRTWRDVVRAAERGQEVVESFRVCQVDDREAQAPLVGVVMEGE
jgi:hypothetical protein